MVNKIKHQWNIERVLNQKYVKMTVSITADGILAERERVTNPIVCFNITFCFRDFDDSVYFISPHGWDWDSTALRWVLWRNLCRNGEGRTSCTTAIYRSCS